MASSLEEETECEQYYSAEDLDAETNEPDVEEDIDLSLLPLDLQHRIVEKLEYKEYALLDQTSCLGNYICSNGSYSLPFKAKNVYVNKKTTKVVEWYNDWYPFVEKRIPWHAASCSPVRIVTDFVRIECRASCHRIQALSKLFEKNHTKADILSITEHIIFKPEDMERLIQACNPRVLQSKVFLGREFFKCPSVQNLPTLDLENTGCTDEEFLKMKANDFVRIDNDQITAKGLNKFLKQWKNKEREIYVIKINYDTTAGIRSFEEILDGLDANPIWTPDLHQDSLVGRIPTEEFFYRTREGGGDPEHLYSMWRPDDPENTIFIMLRSKGIEIRQLTWEADYLYNYLDFDQYYWLREECIICATRFCYHRGRCSIMRLKKKLPVVYSGFIYGIKGLTILSAITRVLNFSMGKNPYILFPKQEQEFLGHHTGLTQIISLLRVYLLEHC